MVEREGREDELHLPDIPDDIGTVDADCCLAVAECPVFVTDLERLFDGGLADRERELESDPRPRATLEVRVGLRVITLDGDKRRKRPITRRTQLNREGFDTISGVLHDRAEVVVTARDIDGEATDLPCPAEMIVRLVEHLVEPMTTKAVGLPDVEVETILRRDRDISLGDETVVKDDGVLVDVARVATQPEIDRDGLLGLGLDFRFFSVKSGGIRRHDDNEQLLQCFHG